MAILTEEERDIDPYDVLGIAPEALDKDVRKAYRKKSLKCHPDKNPGPKAEEMFHLISMAQAMLLNPDKRKFVDTKLAQSRAAAARRAVMDSKRKVKVDDLLRREEEAKRAKKDAVVARKAAAEEEAVRDAGRRLVEEARKRREAAASAASAAEAATLASEAEAVSQSSKPPPISSQDLTISLQLPPSCTLSQGELESALSGRYGQIAGVILAPAKQKEGKKARGPRAIVEFAPGNWGGCWACLHDNASAAVPGAKAKWASGAEPAWVKWADARNAGSTTTSGTNGASFASAPDFSNGSTDAHRQREEQRAEDAALESATLLRMRQRERERLAEEIRRQEAEDE